jgi:hypothetical protein
MDRWGRTHAREEQSKTRTQWRDSQYEEKETKKNFAIIELEGVGGGR